MSVIANTFVLWDYQVDMDSVQNWLAFVSACCAFAYGAWRWAGKRIWGKIHDFFVRINVTTNNVSVAMPVLLKIAEEFKPNGGNSLRDIINKIESELQLLGKKKNFIIDLSNLSVFENDAKGNCIWASKKLTEYFGLDREDILGDGWMIAIHQDDREKTNKEWQMAVTENRECLGEYRVVNQTTNKTSLMRWRGFPIKNKHGKILGFLGTVLPANQESISCPIASA